jgi:hypothetical protein
MTIRCTEPGNCEEYGGTHVLFDTATQEKRQLGTVFLQLLPLWQAASAIWLKVAALHATIEHMSVDDMRILVNSAAAAISL